MTAERWQVIKTILAEAMDLEQSLRAAFVAAQCGDDVELRAEVESLLASDATVGSRLVSSTAIGKAMAAAVGSSSNHGPQETFLFIDRYQLEREIGSGGMSAVYLARDMKLLNKRVVVKVLLETTSEDAWVRQKFQQEMEALSRINHPGVVTVLDTGTTPDGKQFLVMPFVEGCTLRDCIPTSGMDLRRAVNIIRQTGQALEAAHAKGVWHRDLKPENIMIESSNDEDHVKIIDFGIAGIQNSQFVGEKTQVAGTLTYMAPEQFSGKPCAASDTYSLGVVAYEMLTGQKTFPSNSMDHLLKEDLSWSESFRQLRPELPYKVNQSLAKAMAFQPKDRYKHVAAFGEELNGILNGNASFPIPDGVLATEPISKASPSSISQVFSKKGLLGGILTATLLAIFIFTNREQHSRNRLLWKPEENSIAILPLKPLGEPVGKSSFREGLMEQLSGSLLKEGWLVTANYSANKAQQEERKTLQDIGQELKVDRVLAGSVQWHETRIRTSIQMVKAANSQLLWSETFESDMRDPFQEQDRIVHVVCAALGLKQAQEMAGTNQTISKEARQAYQEGLLFLNKEKVRNAESSFETALQLSPFYAEAWAGLAAVKRLYAVNLPVAGALPRARQAAISQAKEAANRALELNPKLAWPFRTLGFISLQEEGDFAEAEKMFKRGLELEPNRKSMVYAASILAKAQGRLQDALILNQRVVKIDPLAFLGHQELGHTMLSMGKNQEALEPLRTALDLNPKAEVIHQLLSRAYLALRDNTKALEEALQEKNEAWRSVALAMVYYDLGRHQESDMELSKLIRTHSKDAPFNIAQVYAFRGDKNKTFEWLNRAVIERDDGLVLEVQSEPLFTALRVDDKYRDILKFRALSIDYWAFIDKGR